MADPEVVSGPRHVVVVVGTATEVGKTWVTAHLIHELLRRGLGVCARKPLQSYDPASSEPTDAAVLAAASGESPEVICPADRSLPVPMAPPMAAEVLGRGTPTLTELIAELHWTDGIDLGVVETVGGVRSPLAADGDSRDLALALSPATVVLVADGGLGVIDTVRKSVDAMAPIRPLVYLNRHDPLDDLHRRNREWLTERDGFDVLVGINALADRLVGRDGTGTERRP